ncbi:hypothetical protein [Nonomuraea sediminis]|uniref:hypothetical protein n=1 Tax=Nonomuraea sediminis TaxID=2835864 RepID=UPI001BDD1189|nr:hypothetical protein [Nonomuraea sediminis]
MDIPLLIVALAVVLAAATLALFVVLVISIHRDDNRRTLDTAPSSAQALTRNLLGAYAHHCPPSALCPGRR